MGDGRFISFIKSYFFVAHSTELTPYLSSFFARHMKVQEIGEYLNI